MVNQMLTEMDGFRKDELVFVVGTTNFAESIDPALLRPGRFELLIDIPYPTREDRRAIIEIYGKKFNLDLSQEMVDYIVDKTGGFVDEQRGVRFSGDHLYAICRALKREEIRKGSLTVDTEDVEKAINSRSKSPVKFSPEEERTIAIHEAGHAMLAHFLPYPSAVEKITISTGDEDTLGYVMRSVKQNKYITTRKELLDDICVLLGGRVAEDMVIGDISVGAYNDLQKATTLARAMLEELGMGKTLGLRTIAGRQGIGRTTVRENVAEATAARVDDEIVALLEAQRARAEQLLIDRRQTFDLLVDELLEKKTLESAAIVELLGEPAKVHRTQEKEEPKNG
jgi:cell division protease FtsH